MIYSERQGGRSRGTMDEDVEKEREVLSTVSDTLLLFMECMTEKYGKRPEHISAVYEEVIRVVKGLKDQF